MCVIIIQLIAIKLQKELYKISKYQQTSCGYTSILINNKPKKKKNKTCDENDIVLQLKNDVKKKISKPNMKQNVNAMEEKKNR